MTRLTRCTIIHESEAIRTSSMDRWKLSRKHSGFVGDECVNAKCGSAAQPFWIINSPNDRAQVAFGCQLHRSICTDQAMQENLVSAAINGRFNYLSFANRCLRISFR